MIELYILIAVFILLIITLVWSAIEIKHYIFYSKLLKKSEEESILITQQLERLKAYHLKLLNKQN